MCRASATASASPTRWRWTARRKPPASCASRSKPRSAGPAQHADGQRHRARGVGQLPHRAAGGHRRRGGLPAQRPGARWTGGHPPHHRHRRAGAAVPFGFSPTGEAFNLTMEDVATSDRHCAAGRQAGLRDRGARHPRTPGPDPESNPIDTELPLAEAKRCWPRCRPQQPTDTAFYLQHCVKACEGGVERSTSCPLRPTAPCCWRSSRTTASAPWWSTRSSKACARPRPTTWAASCS
jgi:hypothetical protein